MSTKPISMTLSRAFEKLMDTGRVVIKMKSGNSVTINQHNNDKDGNPTFLVASGSSVRLYSMQRMFSNISEIDFQIVDFK